MTKKKLLVGIFLKKKNHVRLRTKFQSPLCVLEIFDSLLSTDAFFYTNKRLRVLKLDQKSDMQSHTDIQN